jgi:hypothetical protein
LQRSILFTSACLTAYKKACIHIFLGNFLILKGVNILKLTNEERALVLGAYIAESGATVRDAARKYGISKSTVHKDVTKPKGDFFVFLADGNP